MNGHSTTTRTITTNTQGISISIHPNTIVCESSVMKKEDTAESWQSTAWSNALVRVQSANCESTVVCCVPNIVYYDGEWRHAIRGEPSW